MPSIYIRSACTSLSAAPPPPQTNSCALNNSRRWYYIQSSHFSVSTYRKPIGETLSPDKSLPPPDKDLPGKNPPIIPNFELTDKLPTTDRHFSLSKINIFVSICQKMPRVLTANHNFKSMLPCLHKSVHIETVSY